MTAARTRAWVAAAAGALAAATGHYLDATGRLPFVEETGEIRRAMPSIVVALWLLLAAGGSALAVRTRLFVVGIPVVLVVSATPELYGRHDLGALGEPGAIVGALLQLLVIGLVVATGLVLTDGWSPLRLRAVGRPAAAVAEWLRRSAPAFVVRRDSAPRAPPAVV